MLVPSVSAQITLLLAEIVESAQVGATPVFLTVLFSLTVCPRKHQNLWVATMKVNLQLPHLILMERDALHFTEINPSSSIVVVLQHSIVTQWNMHMESFTDELCCNYLVPVLDSDVLWVLYRTQKTFSAYWLSVRKVLSCKVTNFLQNIYT